ncbi:hypothetical protein GCM10009853_025810 [Glycomyces scopariae]
MGRGIVTEPVGLRTRTARWASRASGRSSSSGEFFSIDTGCCGTDFVAAFRPLFACASSGAKCRPALPRDVFAIPSPRSPLL